MREERDKKKEKVFMTETTIWMCWIQVFKIVFFSKNVGKKILDPIIGPNAHSIAFDCHLPQLL